MSIATAITNLQGRVESAYDKIEERGGTLPQVLNTANLPDAIDSIPSGGGGGSPIWGIQALSDVCQTDSNGNLNTWAGVKSVNFDGVSSISRLKTMYSMFYGNTNLSSVTFPDLQMISDINAVYAAFKDCTNMLSISFPNLSSVHGASAMISAMQGCTSLTSVSFPELRELSGSNIANFLFKGCTSLTNVSFPKLSAIYGNTGFSNTFNGCTNLTSVSFPALKLIDAVASTGGNVFVATLSATKVSSLTFPELTAAMHLGTSNTYSLFNQNPTLTSLYFPKLSVISTSTTGVAAKFLFNNCTNLVEIHFGEENQSIIEGSSGYATKWGAPNANCQIYFDL